MDKLPKVKERSSKRVGRGYGSGKGGHTSGRGQKGQKTRKKIPLLFEGIKVKKSLIKRLPLQRGKGKLKPQKKSIAMKIERLNVFKAGENITLEKLVKSGMVSRKRALLGVKIVDGGKLAKKLTIELPVTSAAARKIKKAGGTIVK
ncbi:MAG: 50S ribosomal protein L15 [Candidatus Woesebacteria bacterium GW2011_GWB1_43_14]|uniref:Large ribosomal subunit protein uL15 n=1 Tax=Candidatus Woesebacteria bacterium GW2011_GWB1_43_14 TaxID=1618578 RepID=A0A0G1FQS1_9BACT|nr:MAG: 50S ribosomal protein L15 [Candidatus Woesebacteria bacterium GW2011_GWA1_39_11b]KKS78034.1 MAG: 50S ribosomal protein L15 [Candidatus Woesebacteria bacterium GW2011_GWC1_42_9]KKS97386.1 MAG: 50S ribosomal protein L15 [Candidatus Woesebacteria bacterium GW2011_GWB1_43_14]